MGVCFLKNKMKKKFRVASCHLLHGMNCFVLLLSKTCCGAAGEGAAGASPRFILLYKVISCVAQYHRLYVTPSDIRSARHPASPTPPNPRLVYLTKLLKY